MQKNKKKFPNHPISLLNGNREKRSENVVQPNKYNKLFGINDPYTEKKISNVLKVMDFLLSANRPVTVPLIRHSTGLNAKQVYKSVEFLHKMGSITKTYRIAKERYSDPPVKYLSVSLNKHQFKMAWRYLRKHGLIWLERIRKKMSNRHY